MNDVIRLGMEKINNLDGGQTKISIIIDGAGKFVIIKKHLSIRGHTVAYINNSATSGVSRVAVHVRLFWTRSIAKVDTQTTSGVARVSVYAYVVLEKNNFNSDNIVHSYTTNTNTTTTTT